MKVSVLIITRNRPLLLKECLSSLFKQQRLPEEVIVVDSSKDNKSWQVCETFKKKNATNLRYYKETRLGFGQARNTALDLARNEIIFFIDDDCVARADWIMETVSFLKENKADVVLGRCLNFYPESIFACIQQSYYERWLLENLSDLQSPQRVRTRSFFDLENVAFRKEFIDNFRCRTDLPFNGMNEDWELGYRILKKGKVYFNPQMIVFHKHQTSLIPLMKRNFRQGFADGFLIQKGMTVREKKWQHSYAFWLKACFSLINKLNTFQKFIFMFFLFTYPFSYKTGQLVFKIKKAG